MRYGNSFSLKEAIDNGTSSDIFRVLMTMSLNWNMTASDTGYNIITLIARFMGPTWGSSGADMTQVGPMLAHELYYLWSFTAFGWINDVESLSLWWMIGQCESYQ